MPLCAPISSAPSISSAPHRLTLAAALIASVALAACAAQTNVSLHMATAHTYAAELADTDAMLISMQTGAVMEYTGGGQHFKLRENIVVRRPASLRVEALSALGVALVLAADGGQVTIYDPGKNTLMHGLATAAVLDRYARIPMAPEAAVRLLMGLSPDAGMLAFPPDLMIHPTDPNGLEILRYKEPLGVTDDLGFGPDGYLAQVRETRADGRVNYEVNYSDYQDIGGGQKFPRVIAASFPTTGASVTFRYDNPVINKDIPDSTFVLAPDHVVKHLDLGMIGGATTAGRG
ncbi:MAG: DUF4292 domain-containing protein [Candidatus Binataceae bacterium]|nr:DUF4292 domain-containing protein [Candidatus Binataceae bacterium]